MGKCYMEFTTYFVLTRRENPFDFFVRKKRDVNEVSVNEDELVSPKNSKFLYDEVFEQARSIPSERQAQIQTIKVGDLNEILRKISLVLDHVK